MSPHDQTVVAMIVGSAAVGVLWGAVLALGLHRKRWSDKDSP